MSIYSCDRLHRCMDCIHIIYQQLFYAKSTTVRLHACTFAFSINCKCAVCLCVCVQLRCIQARCIWVWADFLWKLSKMLNTKNSCIYAFCHIHKCTFVFFRFRVLRHKNSVRLHYYFFGLEFVAIQMQLWHSLNRATNLAIKQTSNATNTFYIIHNMKKIHVWLTIIRWWWTE